VPSEHIGMFHVDGVFASILQPGYYAYWHGGKRLSLTTIDTRLTVIEITGQEMLTQDKVQLRVNVTAGYKIVDGRLVTSSLNDYKDFIYKEIQFALRAAIGSRTLDGLLENKNETDDQILGYMQQKAVAQGIAIISLGIKDLILPGEIKAILGKVVEAEKAAQANVIRRREETAATRSLMNTAKVMEDNPVALRLKELETLEKITERIEHLNVYGGLEGLLKQIVPFKPAA
jgi:regulator of protease activity HflC (stomatin/prohibitin superfamily)